MGHNGRMNRYHLTFCALVLTTLASGCHRTPAPRCEAPKPVAPEVPPEEKPSAGDLVLAMDLHRFKVPPEGQWGLESGEVSVKARFVLPGALVERASGEGRMECRRCTVKIEVGGGIRVPVEVEVAAGRVEVKEGTASLRGTARVAGGVLEAGLEATVRLMTPLEASVVVGELKLTLPETKDAHPVVKLARPLLSHMRSPDGSYRLKITGNLGRLLSGKKRASLPNLADSPGPEPPSPLAPDPPPRKPEVDGVKEVAPGRYVIKRKWLNGVLADSQALMRGARVVPSVRDGKVNGFKLYAIRPGSLYAALGLRNGDTVTMINGMELDSPDKALKIYAAVTAADRVTVHLLRRGKKQTKVYLIK